MDPELECNDFHSTLSPFADAMNFCKEKTVYHVILFLYFSVSVSAINCTLLLSVEPAPSAGRQDLPSGGLPVFLRLFQSGLSVAASRLPCFQFSFGGTAAKKERQTSADRGDHSQYSSAGILQIL